MRIVEVVGQNVRDHRVAAKLSQEELARRINRVAETQVDQGYVSRLEAGQINLRVAMLWCVAKALGVPLNSLVDENGKVTSKLEQDK